MEEDDDFISEIQRPSKGKASKTPTPTKAMLVQQCKASKNPTASKVKLVQPSKATKTPRRQVIRPPPIPLVDGRSNERILHGTDKIRNYLKNMEKTFSVPTAAGVYQEIIFQCVERMFHDQRQNPKNAISYSTGIVNAPLAISWKQQTPEEKNKCNIISKQKYRKMYKELKNDKVKLSDEFKSPVTSTATISQSVPPRRKDQLKPDDPIFWNHVSLLHKTFSTTWKGRVAELRSQALIPIDCNHHKEIAALERAKLVAESKSMTEASVTETSDDGNDCPVVDVVNIIHMGQIRKKRRQTIGVQPVDDYRNVSDNRLVDVDIGEKSGQTSKNLPGDGHAAVSNTSVSRQFSPSSSSSEAHDIKFMQFETQLSTSLRAIGLELVHVPADGNCLFSALALQFYGVRDYQFHIRQVVVEQMELNPARYEDFHTSDEPFTKYVKDLRKDGTYGDNHVLAAFANEFKVSVKVFQPDGSHISIPHPGSIHPTVQVAYNSYNHYYSVKDVGRAALSVGEGEGEEVENHRDDEHLGRTTKGIDNGVSLQGRSNTEAMEGLRRAVHQEGPKPGHITLTVARKMNALKDREVTLEGQSQDDTQNSPVHLTPGEVVSIDGDYQPQSRPRQPNMMMMSTSNGSSTPDTTMNLPWQQQQQHSNNNIRGPGGKRSGPTDGRRRRRCDEQPQPLPETSMRSDGRHSDSEAPTYTSQTSLDTDTNAPGFSHDQFDRQSMSEKRTSHASMDAKNTDTYQRNKKLRKERERQKQTQPERKTGPFRGDEAPTTTSIYVPLQETVTSFARNKESTSTGTGNVVVRPPTKKSLGMSGVRRTRLIAPTLPTIIP